MFWHMRPNTRKSDHPTPLTKVAAAQNPEAAYVRNGANCSASSRRVRPCGARYLNLRSASDKISAMNACCYSRRERWSVRRSFSSQCRVLILLAVRAWSGTVGLTLDRRLSLYIDGAIGIFFVLSCVHHHQVHVPCLTVPRGACLSNPVKAKKEDGLRSARSSSRFVRSLIFAVARAHSLHMSSYV